MSNSRIKLLPEGNKATVLDDDYILPNGKWAEKIGRKLTKSYSVWVAMKNRCAHGGAVQKIRVSYNDCGMSDNFKDFQYFCNWHRKQIGYNLNYHLDKDLLFSNNKQYSEATCILLPISLNCFIIQSRKNKGKHPTGVHEKRPGQFIAQISLDGRQTYIGTYTTSAQAEKAYLKAKADEAYCWYWRLLDSEFPVDQKVINRLLEMSKESTDE